MQAPGGFLNPKGSVPDTAAHREEADARYAEGSPGEVAKHDARSGSQGWKMAGTGSARIFQLRRSTRQCASAMQHPLRSLPRLAAHVATAQQVAQPVLGAFRLIGETLHSTIPQYSSLPGGAVSSQTPEAGALCGNSARRDLCGGQRVTTVPTATIRPMTRHPPRIFEWPFDLR
jgi:hypothetical protein